MGGDSQGKSYANTQGNLFVNGPAGGGNAITSGNSDFNIYAEDNWQDSNKDGRFNPYEIPLSEYGGGPTFMSALFNYPVLDIISATALPDEILPSVGASLPYRDYVDCYMVDEFRSLGTEGVLISTEDVLPFGKPDTWNVWAGSNRVDTDSDGMPDVWETANGTDPSRNDAMTKAANGYANIENYINSISSSTVETFLRAPMLLVQQDATPSSVTVSWRDWTEGETAFVIEVERDGVFTEVGRTSSDATSFVIGGLQPTTAYNVRVAACNDGGQSGYALLSVKTMQEQTDMVDVDNYQADYTWKGGDGTWDTSTASWLEGVYTDGSKVLFQVDSETRVTLAEPVSPASVVVRGDADLQIAGSGSLSGSGSLNKAGTGRLTLATANDYTGATVLRGGEMVIPTLANGGVKSSIGASLEYAQNWVWQGGKWKYIGNSVSTNRSAVVYKETEFNIQNASATVTMSGKLEGEAGIILDGKGTLQPSSKGFFSYDGPTTVRGGILNLKGVSTMWSDKICDLGKSSKLVLAGGEFRTHDPNDTYSTYTFPIEVVPDTYSKVYFCRNCSIKSNVSGSGTLDWEINWVREYINGDWRGFYGTLIARGTGSSSNGAQLMFNNSSYKGMPNNVVDLKGNTRVVYWNTNGELWLGGLSGDAGTFLSGSSKNTSGHVMTWHVGGANTDETFAGVIDNCASSTASKYDGTTNIIKEGTGIWRLTGTNIYKGYTNINGGTLIINGKNNGTGAVTVNADATLAGKGSVAGSVTVNEGGSIRPGDSAVSGEKLSLGSSLTVNKGGVVNVPASNKACNTLSVKGNLVLKEGAVLMLADGRLEETPDQDAAFKVLEVSGSISGTFGEIQPATPGVGQTWDTSELYTKGILRVSGEPDGIGDRSFMEPSPVRVDYFSPAGEQVSLPTTGFYVRRSYLPDGRIVTQKVVRQ